MIGDEARVVGAFCAWLAERGWTVEREIAYVDVEAKRDGVTLYAEAKGRTTDPGLDVDTMYGQLLRRMPGEPSASDRFAVVVPSEVIVAAVRVPRWIRQRLNITIYAVDAEGEVSEIE
jgi:hypothetical protein